MVGCALKRIGDLAYNHQTGACNTYLFPQERILICFSDDPSDERDRKCERLVSPYTQCTVKLRPNFEKIAQLK